MVVKQYYLDLILVGEKVFEIRHCQWTPEKVFLGYTGFIYGSARLQKATNITTHQHFKELRNMHCVDAEVLPYRKHNWGIPLTEVRRIEPPVPYVHPRGTQTRAKYCALPLARTAEL